MELMVMKIHLLTISCPNGFALGENKGTMYYLFRKNVRAFHMSIRPVHDK